MKRRFLFLVFPVLFLQSSSGCGERKKPSELPSNYVPVSALRLFSGANVCVIERDDPTVFRCFGGELTQELSRKTTVPWSFISRMTLGSVVATRSDNTLWLTGPGSELQQHGHHEWRSAFRVALGAYNNITYYLKTDGTLWKFFDSVHSQPDPQRIQIGADNDWMALAASISLKTNGTMWRLSSSDAPPVVTPVQIGKDSDWASIAADPWSGCALKRDGSLWCWGSSDAEPKMIDADKNWIKVAIWGASACGLKSDHSLWCWGQDSTPVQTAADNTWKDVAINDGTIFATRDDDTLWAMRAGTQPQQVLIFDEKACVVDLDCDDTDPCTEDSCVPGQGCTHKDNTILCNSGNPCMENETKCREDSLCSGSRIFCEPDDLPCTRDGACDPEKGCFHVSNCTTGNPCAEPVCTSQGCAEVIKTDGFACDDNNWCTEVDVCVAGACTGSPPVKCPDDGNPCTDENCDPYLKCQPRPVINDTPCEGTGHCRDGYCVH